FNKLLEPLRNGTQKMVRFITKHRRNDGSLYPVEVHLQLVTMDSALVFVAIILDITERLFTEESLRLKTAEIEQTHKKLERSHQQTLQAEKLASVGQLAAGIAHEINTPIQFVGDNTRFLQESFQDLLALVRLYEALNVGEPGNTREAALVKKVHTLRPDFDSF
ncbi:MAG: PAS domain S-box protein, partial [Candidatus Thiodiazotropha sp. (ex Lucinoma kastoroae)]|nr:PAS domain S-box protein [Candidatus Thiodiazotropha sp. (ex Lucinoma kastoroae)]